MVYTKRLIIATILGMLAGLACAYVSKASLMAQLPPEMVPGVMCNTALNRTFIGFMIGISCWRMHWVLHGIIIGFLGTLAIAAPLIGQPGNEMGFIMMVVGGIFWGFLIELFTTVIFKAPMKCMVKEAPAPPPPPPPEPAPPTESAM